MNTIKIKETIKDELKILNRMPNEIYVFFKKQLKIIRQAKSVFNQNQDFEYTRYSQYK